MNDYEKFDQNLDTGKLGEEFSDLNQIVNVLKQSSTPPSASAERDSRLRMLAEIESVQAEDSAKRVRRLGAIFAWAVPAILILAVAGVMFGNAPGTNDGINTLSGNEDENPGVLATAVPLEEENDVQVEATSTVTSTGIVTDDGPLATALPSELERSTIISSTIDSSTSITIPLEDGTELEVPQPVLPIPGGGAGQPVDTQGGSESETSGAPEE